MSTSTAIKTRPDQTKISSSEPGQWIGKTRMFWGWTIFLLLINLPLFKGEIRMELLFFPDAVMNGQWWRVITYPLVHLSWYHFALDAGGFILLLYCLEDRRILVLALYIMSASIGSLVLSLAIDPTISQRGLSGLSGIAHGLMAVTAVEMLWHKRQWVWGLISLGMVTTKSAYELWSGEVLFEFMHMGMCGHPLAASHAGGVMGGLLAFALVISIGRPKRKSLQSNYKKKPSPSVSHTVLTMVAKILTHLMYRVRYRRIGGIPGQGPAVLVCNHVSYVDWLIIASASRRPIHFVMHASIYKKPLLKWFFRMARVIPIDSGRNNIALLYQAFQKIASALEAGGLVCIFPEGHLTRNGEMDRFRPGIEKILKYSPAPVVPLALNGLWGSFFSRKNGETKQKRPQRFRARIELTIGNQISPHLATAKNLQDEVQKLYNQCKKVRSHAKNKA